ncbi:hypothetical protein F5884DRAFT_777148 [Xylogone sp. PMI_703]|nr:hypothetical protein F5884DRAFT_777148 [Xylogone sp. PMI_703]
MGCVDYARWLDLHSLHYRLRCVFSVFYYNNANAEAKVKVNGDRSGNGYGRKREGSGDVFSSELQCWAIPKTRMKLGKQGQKKARQRRNWNRHLEFLVGRCTHMFVRHTGIGSGYVTLQPSFFFFSKLSPRYSLFSLALLGWGFSFTLYCDVLYCTVAYAAVMVIMAVVAV